MGVYIPFAKKLPCDCNACFVAISGCKVKNPYINGRPTDCPLVEIKPHGRLIDADVLNKDIEHSVVFSARQQKQNAEIRGAFKVYDRIKVAPTIIEAEGEE